jgi:DNA-directed RNA polymerase subunit omega
MARITVEDCLEVIPNRFSLCLVTAKRAQQLMKGESPLVNSDNKEIVTALREVAEGRVRLDTSDFDENAEVIVQRIGRGAVVEALPPAEFSDDSDLPSEAE